MFTQSLTKDIRYLVTMMQSRFTFNLSTERHRRKAKDILHVSGIENISVININNYKNSLYYNIELDLKNISSDCDSKCFDKSFINSFILSKILSFPCGTVQNIDNSWNSVPSQMYSRVCGVNTSPRKMHYGGQGLYSVPNQMFTNRCHLHTSSSTRDVPDYLVGSITEVDCPEPEDNTEETENELEEEIIEFLSCRGIPFDEMESSFTVPCPTCSSSKHSKQSQDIFVDKHSGYYVCPWCCCDGSWEELCRLLDARQDSLTDAQLAALIGAAAPVTQHNLATLLNNSPYKSLSVATLSHYGCLVTTEGDRLLVPVWAGTQLCGYYSVPLLNPANKVVSRFTRGSARVWSSLVAADGVSSSSGGKDTNNNNSRLVIVSHVCEALYLAQCGVHAATVPPGVDWNAPLQQALNRGGRSSERAVWGLTRDVRHVALWLTNTNVLPYRFFAHLNKETIACGAVSPAGAVPLYHLTATQLTMPLKGKLLPMLEDKVVRYDNLQEQVFHRITHKYEVYGVPFTRFAGLQSTLLGHRTGEVTVVSGPTGAGKTTLMAEYSLDLASNGVVTLWVSLEVSIVRLCEVLLQQYSGAPLPVQRHLFTALSQDFKQLPLFFLDLHGQQDLQHIIQVLRTCVVTRGVRHVVVDNLQFLVGCQDTASERWLQQDRAMAAFRAFATQQGCHVTLIVHPRKLAAGELLTMQSIGGGARVTQEADNVLLLQVTEGNKPGAERKAVQVVKNRFGGHLGVMPLKFHQDSLTLSGWFKATKKKSIGS